MRVFAILMSAATILATPGFAQTTNVQAQQGAIRKVLEGQVESFRRAGGSSTTIPVASEQEIPAGSSAF